MTRKLFRWFDSLSLEELDELSYALKDLAIGALALFTLCLIAFLTMLIL